MPNTENRKNSNKKPTLQEHSQTVIIPQLTPEMLEQARRAAEQGKTAEQIEQEALAAAQAEQKAVESKQEAPTAEKPKTVQPANKPKTRKEAEEELAQNIHDDHLWLNNPVMVRGLGLAPIVAAAVSGQNAWMLCAAAILLVTATRMLAVAICHLTGNRFRGVVYSYAAAIVYIPAYIILYNLFGADLSLLGIYLPMLVVEPAVIKRMESNDLETVGEAFRRGINNTIGICFSVLLVGVVRELLAEGTVFGNVVFPVAPLPLADQPGTGFIIIGLIAAVWTAIGGAYVHYKSAEVRHLSGTNRKRCAFRFAGCGAVPDLRRHGCVCGECSVLPRAGRFPSEQAGQRPQNQHMAVLHSHHSGTDHQRPHGLGCPKLNAARFGKGAARLAAGQRPAPAGIFELLTDRYGHCVAAVGPVPQKPRCLPRTAARRNLQLLRAGHPAGCSQPEL